jgi:hypothetical protein
MGKGEYRIFFPSRLLRVKRVFGLISSSWKEGESLFVFVINFPSISHRGSEQLKKSSGNDPQRRRRTTNRTTPLPIARAPPTPCTTHTAAPPSAPAASSLARRRIRGLVARFFWVLPRRRAMEVSVCLLVSLFVDG